jgi:hypothetical protein
LILKTQTGFTEAVNQCVKNGNGISERLPPLIADAIYKFFRQNKQFYLKYFWPPSTPFFTSKSASVRLGFILIGQSCAQQDARIA